jgi:hypothetical protein
VNSYAPTLKMTSLPYAAGTPLFGSSSAQSAANTASAADSKSHDWDLSFHNLLDIVNPLQHLPVIGTLYRALTGSHIGMPEKIAGDALYGGLWGAVSSVADAGFEAVTGQDFGSTVLALFTGSHHDSAIGFAGNVTVTPSQMKPQTDNVQVASAAPASLVPASAAIQTPDVAALAASLSQNGVNNDLAQRALFAYRQTMGASAPAPVLAALH